MASPSFDAGAMTPAWLKTTPRAPRSTGSAEPAAAETPVWLKSAALVQQTTHPDGVPVGAPGVIIFKRADNSGDPTDEFFKLGSLKVPEVVTAAVLRRRMKRELPQLRRLYPRGWFFAVSGAPIMRTQEGEWSSRELACMEDGWSHISLLPSSDGAHGPLRERVKHSALAVYHRISTQASFIRKKLVRQGGSSGRRRYAAEDHACWASPLRLVGQVRRPGASPRRGGESPHRRLSASLSPRQLSSACALEIETTTTRAPLHGPEPMAQSHLAPYSDW